jgi:hypothetical protein
LICAVFILKIIHQQTIIFLRELPIGARLHYRSKNDWRSAVVSQLTEEKATLIVCSPSGGTYRLRRSPETEVIFDGTFHLLKQDSEEDWRANFTRYDSRW